MKTNFGVARRPEPTLSRGDENISVAMQRHIKAYCSPVSRTQKYFLQSKSTKPHKVFSFPIEITFEEILLHSLKSFRGKKNLCDNIMGYIHFASSSVSEIDREVCRRVHRAVSRSVRHALRPCLTVPSDGSFFGDARQLF